MSNRREPAAARTFGRAAHWTVGLAAALLVLISAGGYFYHRNQLLAIVAEHVRLVVTGPDTLHAGVAAEYLVSVTAVDGQPLSAQIEAVLSDSGGRRLKAYRESADTRGRLRVLIPGDLNLPSHVTLKVAAQHAESREHAELPLTVAPPDGITCLTTDRPCYAPGETIRYRSLTLSRIGWTAERESDVLFEVLDSQGRQMPQLVQRQTTQRGVASGEFSAALRWPAGDYALVARSPDGRFPEQRAPFVLRDAGDEEPNEAESAEKAAAQKINVMFQPEGGSLVAGRENRVYFFAQDARGRPLRLSGMVVNDADQNAKRPGSATTVQTTIDGLGAFNMIPEVGKRYRLKVSVPAGVADQPALPAVVADLPATLVVGSGVFAAGQPLEFNVQAVRTGLPLVAAAYVGGTQVGQQPLVSRAGANPVSIALPAAVGGVVRVAVFSYEAGAPKRLAERLVFRRPAGRLDVRLAGLKASYAPGEKARATVSVTNERGRPVAAALGIAVGDRRVEPAADFFLLTDEVSRPRPLRGAAFFLSEKKQGDVSGVAALDLLLGVQPASAAACRPPRMFDNLTQIRENYQKSLAEYQAGRTRVLNTLTIVSFLGGLGLVLLVAMLGLMQIVSGLSLWAATIGAATCCLIVGAILMDPIQQGARLDRVVAFASNPAGAEKPPTSESATKMVAFPMEMSEVRRNSTEPPYWNPLLIVGTDGKASWDVVWPDAAATFFATVDAHGDGRLGSAQAEIVVKKQNPQ
ncbi:MAG: MG2 domain-containing protein [Thermoguttaceae bacterium]